MMSSGFWGNLGHEIEVEVSPTLFHFRSKNKELSLKPVVFMATDGKPRVLGIGEIPILTENFVKIDLFHPGGSASPFVERAECLGLFFQYAIKLMTGRYAIIRPLLRFRNTVSLREILWGYEKVVLDQAAGMGGARGCVFLD